VKVSAELAAQIPANALPAFRFYQAKGLTAVQASGAPGNYWAESGIEPDRNQDGGGPGRGIAQWSDPGRWSTFLAMFGAPTGNNTIDLARELEFSWWELTHGYAETLAKLKATSTPEDAAAVICEFYEAPLVQPQPQRGVFARIIYDAYADEPPPPPPITPSHEENDMVFLRQSQPGQPDYGGVVLKNCTQVTAMSPADWASGKVAPPNGPGIPTWEMTSAGWHAQVDEATVTEVQAILVEHSPDPA